MKIKHIVIEDNIEPNTPIALSSKQQHYLKNVLRKKDNDLIKVNAKNGICIAKILDINSTPAMIITEKIEEKIKYNKIKIHLYQSLCQQKKMDLIVQKATELGVSQITPIITNRGKIKIESDEKELRKINRLKEIATNACQQSQNPETPIINKISNINSILIKKEDLSIALQPGVEYTLHSFEPPEPDIDINIFIGPEGGFDNDELDKLNDYGVHLVKFGPRVLRCETAAIAVIAALNVIWGDCK